MIPGLLAALVLHGAGLAAAGVPAPVVQAVSTPAETALAAFDPLLGKTWRGASVTDDRVIDEVRFERVAGGQAIRSVHSVNGGAYTGDTLIVFDADSGRLVSFYATNGGFYTTGTVEVLGPGTFEFEQTVHGLEGVDRVRARTELVDGVYRIRSQHHRNGEWVDTGGFDYRAVP